MNGPSSELRTNRLANPVPLAGIQPVTDWPWAQARVNFVVVGPRAGSPWRIVEASVRGESPTHHSTVRFYLEDAHGGRIRCKQYFNDWWIPTVSDISFRGPGRPLVFGDTVAFLGRDYRRHEGTCGHRWGTAVECSLERGSLDATAWTALWNGFDALDPGAVAEARASTFARRNYWNRWKRTHAPWDTSEISSLTWTDPSTEAMERCSWAISADRWAPVPGSPDSLGTTTGPFGDEVQAVFRWPMTLNTSAWLRVLREPPEPWRPLLDASEVNRPSWRTLEIGGRAVERAAMDPAVGNWYYAWREGKKAHELHLRARPGLDARAADAAVRGLLA